MKFKLRHLSAEEERLFDEWDDGECVCGHDIMDHDEPGDEDEDERDPLGPWKCTVDGCKCNDFETVPCPVEITEPA